jgi:hypothetical protein
MLPAVAVQGDKGAIVKPIQTAAILLVAAIAWHAPSAGAQTSIAPMTVDEVNVRPLSIDVTGVVQGSTTATTRTFSPTIYANTDLAGRSAALDRCHRSLLLALSKPGQYVARIGTDTCTIALAAP